MTLIKLKNILRERKVLSVFDFDDTIALTDSWIYVMKNGREIKKLDPAQFAIYKPRPGETFDFRDFDKKIRNPRLIKQNAQLLMKQLDKARRQARGSRKVTILTARRLGAPVTSFFRSIGLDVYVVPLGSANPLDKANWIEAQIKKGYDTVYFMDDSPKNIRAVDNMLRRYPNVRSLTKLIKEVDYHSKLSRGHKPDYYQLGTSEFKPFDKSRDEDVEENFADGKKPGRKGISKRVGIPKKATLTQLAKLAKAKGEKGRMARWQLNMRRGRKKAAKKK